MDLMTYIDKSLQLHVEDILKNANQIYLFRNNIHCHSISRNIITGNVIMYLEQTQFDGKL